LNYLISILLLFCVTSISQSATFAYITNQVSDTVSVIDTSSNQVIKHIEVGHRPAGVTASSDGKRVYISNPESQEISIIGNFYH